jgi:methionyl-tRNA synthetase
LSKSSNNAIDPYELKEFWGLEPLKFLLFREATLMADSEFCDEVMIHWYNKDLADTFANLMMRVQSEKLNPQMKVPEPSEFNATDRARIDDVEALPGTVDHWIALGRTRFALFQIWDVLRGLNKYLSEEKPWLAKARRATIMYVVYESLRITTLCLWPFMSDGAAAILRGLGAPPALENDPEVMFNFGLLRPGTKLTPVPFLYSKKYLDH